ncbi:cytochrome P450 2C25-like [Pelodytes ibericus]
MAATSSAQLETLHQILETHGSAFLQGVLERAQNSSGSPFPGYSRSPVSPGSRNRCSRKCLQEGRIKEYTLGEVELKLNMFADDILVTLRNPVESLEALMSSLEEFSKISNYRLNLNKTVAMPIAVKKKELKAMQENYSFKWTPDSLEYLVCFKKRRGDLYSSDRTGPGIHRIMGIFLLLGLSLSVLLTLLIFTSYLKQQKRSRLLPPGPPALPLLGNPIYVTKAGIGYYAELRQKYGPIFTVWKLNEPMVVLCGYEMVNDALVNHADKFSDRPRFPVSELFSKGYAMRSDSLYWKSYRRFLLTSLRNVGMGKKTMEDLIHTELKHLILAMSGTGGKPCNPFNHLGFAVNSVISTVLFGEQLDYQDPKLHKLVTATRQEIMSVQSLNTQICDTFPILLYLPFIRHKLFSFTFNLRNFVREHVHHHKQSLDLKSPRDVLDYFLVKIKEQELTTNSHFNDISLETTITGLLAAGTDTTSSTLKFCLAAMAHFPDIQETVQQEIDHEIGPQRFPGMKDRPQLPYTNAVIHECQRVLDLAPIAHYHAVQQETHFRGFTLPKGTMVIPYLSSVLSDPSHWKTPNKFNPGNFLDENGEFKANPAFLVFSTGKRICLGENLARTELFLFFSTLLQRFTFTLTPGSQQLDCSSLGKHKMALMSCDLCVFPRSLTSVS